MVSDHVSVSGLDLSRDKQELLVSYESDQIYTFPAFPSVKSSSGPTVDEIQDLAKSEGNGKALTELAAYGGHLNRFTFLKVRLNEEGAIHVCVQLYLLTPTLIMFAFRTQDTLARKTSTYARGPIQATLGYMKNRQEL